MCVLCVLCVYVVCVCDVCDVCYVCVLCVSVYECVCVFVSRLFGVFMRVCVCVCVCVVWSLLQRSEGLGGDGRLGGDRLHRIEGVVEQLARGPAWRPCPQRHL